MSNTLSKVLNIILGLLLAVTAVLTFLFYNANADVSPDASFAKQIEQLGIFLQYYLNWAFLLAGLAAVSAILFPVLGLIQHPRSGLIAIIALVILGGIVLFAYSMADDTVFNLPGYTGPDNVPSRLKFAGTMLYTLYITAILAVLSILYSEIAKLFK